MEGEFIMIELRAHHGMCIKKFEGKGYSKEFVENMVDLIKRLEEEPITISLKEDLLCEYCPHNKDGCDTSEKVKRYDRECLNGCGMKEGDQMMFQDYSRIIDEKLKNTGRWKEICFDCEWNSICHTD